MLRSCLQTHDLVGGDGSRSDVEGSNVTDIGSLRTTVERWEDQVLHATSWHEKERLVTHARLVGGSWFPRVQHGDMG